MTLEQRIARDERVLKMFLRRGRKYRSEFRAALMKDNVEWRARHREMDEKINILINCQIDTNEQLNRTDEQLKRTDEQIEALVASQAKTDQALDRLAEGQAKTDEALRRFINSLRKNQNGQSEN